MRRTLIIVLLIFLSLVTLLTIAFCAGTGYFLSKNVFGPPPGEGPKAETGYKALAPIIEALERYKANHNSYPEKLDTLVPDYLPDLSVEPEDFQFTYQIEDQSYKLRFNYVGPGMNICTYKPETGWDCFGYY
jgi:hypothetical protein